MGALDLKEDAHENGHSNGPTRVTPPPVDPGSRITAVPTAATPPPVSRPQALPDATTGGVDPPVAVAMPGIPRPKAKA